MNVKRYAREAAAEGCTPEETMRRAIATVPPLNVTGGQITEL